MQSSITSLFFCYVLALLLPSAVRSTNLGGAAVIDVSKTLKTPNAQAGGILYGVPNDPAYAPQTAPKMPDALQKGAGWNYIRAGGAQIPFAGYAANVSGYEQRFASTLANYRSGRAQNAKFVLLPHDLWGADSFTTSTTVYPCDNGDCTKYGQFLDRLIADLKANGMTTALGIDIWNEPDGRGFWPRSQEQYLQAWSYAYAKYRAAFGTSVRLQGPASAEQPSLSSGWWTTFAAYLQAHKDVIPDTWSYHQLNGRSSANCGNDPVDSRNALTAVLQKYGLPNDREVQVNEYGAPDEQTPAYTAWFIGRFERANSVALRANWGSNRGLHDDLARLVLPNNDGFNGWTAMGDWHVLNYYTKKQVGGKVVQTQSTASKCYDSYATLDGANRQIHILAGSRGQEGAYPLTVQGLSGLKTLQGKAVSKVTVTINEIPFNNAGTVNSPTKVSQQSVNVPSNGTITVQLNMSTDSAYTVDVAY